MASTGVSCCWGDNRQGAEDDGGGVGWGKGTARGHHLCLTNIIF